MKFDDPDQEAPFLTGNNNLVLNTPFPGIRIKAAALRDRDYIEVFVSHTRKENHGAISEFVKRERRDLMKNLPPGTIVDPEEAWPIACRSEDPLSDDDKRGSFDSGPLLPNPIVGNDPNPVFGLFFRRYAPFDTFAGLNPLNLFARSEGDKRTSASTSVTDTSRTYGCVMFTRNEIKYNFAGSSGTVTHTLLWADIKGSSKVSMAVTRSTLAGPDLFGFTASTAGGYPLLPSPDIDTTVNARIDFGMPNILRIDGQVLGDNFPNLEVFVVCYRSKHTALLVDGRTTGGRDSGPFFRLFEHSTFPLVYIAVSLPLTENGELAGNSIVAPVLLPDYPKPYPAH